MDDTCEDQLLSTAKAPFFWMNSFVSMVNTSIVDMPEVEQQLPVQELAQAKRHAPLASSPGKEMPLA